MLTKEKLQKELRKIEDEISAIDLAKRLDCHIDTLLLMIQDDVMIPYKEMWNKNKYRIPFLKQDEIKEFFSCETIDLGFLCQHKIKDIKEGLGNKLTNFAHQTMYNSWILHRGY